MSSAYEGLPVYRAATDMVVYFETIVRSFSRYHKYTIGSELRNLSYEVLILIAQANIRVDREVKLKIALEKLQELKSRVQICVEIKAFSRPNNFPTATRKVIDIAKQWIKTVGGSLRAMVISVRRGYRQEAREGYACTSNFLPSNMISSGLTLLGFFSNL